MSSSVIGAILLALVAVVSPCTAGADPIKELPARTVISIPPTSSGPIQQVILEETKFLVTRAHLDRANATARINVMLNDQLEACAADNLRLTTSKRSSVLKYVAVTAVIMGALTGGILIGTRL